MILVISNKKLETTTDKVLRYLHRFNHQFIRINIDNIEQYVQSENIHLWNKLLSTEFNVAWFRKWSYPFFNILPQRKMKVADIQNYFLVMDHVKTEWDVFNEYLFSQIKASYWLSDNRTATPNKLIILEMARQCGLLIPKYDITTSKHRVIAFITSNNCSVILKPLSDVLMFDNDKYITTMLSKKLDASNKLPDVFGLSLIQEYIHKSFEVRIFFLEDQIFPMGIFSQNNSKTKEDFRNYDDVNPNRRVPIKLPMNVMSKIKSFVKLTDYNTGSIDMMVTHTGEYYFLEINPVGQFGMTSFPCRYNLERKVAEYLISKN